eukprot:scaffold2811_cov188-Alexandrium_tamarense.AAC.5
MACLLIQTSWRSSQTSSAYQFVRKGVVSFQSLWRKHVARSSYRSTLTQFVKLQTQWRTHSCLNQYISIRNNVIIVQSAVRRCLVISRLRKIVDASFRERIMFRRYLRWRKKSGTRSKLEVSKTRPFELCAFLIHTTRTYC